MIEISSLRWPIGFFKRITCNDFAFLTGQSSFIAIYKWIPLGRKDTRVKLCPSKPKTEATHCSESSVSSNYYA